MIFCPHLVTAGARQRSPQPAIPDPQVSIRLDRDVFTGGDSR